MLNEDEYLNVNCKNFSQKFVQFVAIVSLITFDIFIILCSWKDSGKYVLILLGRGFVRRKKGIGFHSDYNET